MISLDLMKSSDVRKAGDPSHRSKSLKFGKKFLDSNPTLFKMHIFCYRVDNKWGWVITIVTSKSKKEYYVWVVRDCPACPTISYNLKKYTQTLI